MDDKWIFHFRKHAPIKGEPMTLDEAEKYRLARLNDPNENAQQARLELVRFYGSTGRETDAMRYAEEFLAGPTELEEKAEMYFHQGQLMEHVKDWELALRFYTKALELGRQV
jgi:tetratricopeptide (TPR) repeat protein